MPDSLTPAAVLHWLFEGGLAVKGFFAICETLAGSGLLLTPNHAIIRFVAWLNASGITAAPDEPMTTAVRQAAASFSIQSQHFYALYILGHGTLKLLMVIGLARRIVWAYPAAIVILAGFVVYQVYEWHTSQSVFLLALSGFDGFMIGLVWREWQILKQETA